MAAPGRKSGAAVSAVLFREPWRFDFFQAVRLLELIASQAEGDGAAPHKPVGHDERPDRECVRFRVPPTRSFAASEISALKAGTAVAPAEMDVNFLGLIGPSGVMPQHYNELVIQRLRRFKDTGLQDFLDLFHHRVISLFYRAWEKYRFPVMYERLARSGKPAPLEQEHLDFTWYLHCLVGQGATALRNRLEIDDETFLYYAGHFSHRPQSAVVLETMLAHYFRMPVNIRQFQGQWLYLRPADQSRMPAPGLPQGINARLGLDTIVGDRVWTVESKFRVRLGPVGYREFHDLMPGSRSLRAVCQFVRRYAGRELDFDVQVILRKEEVPPSQLGGDGAPTCLGWNSWLVTTPPPRDAEDAVFVDEGLPVERQE
ncbi:MAG: type VI secretion system baseplate subunit TssG [Planctomycetia bacterium]|nr:type VI secretion system baseplate subunit TssG [Planctomycetia bacterium]